MRKFLLAPLFLLLLSVPALAQLNKFVVPCEASGGTAMVSNVASTSRHPGSYASAGIQIFSPGTTNLVSLFTDSTGSTPAANPGACSAQAQITFWAAASYVYVCVSPAGGSPSPFTFTAATVTPPSTGEYFAASYATFAAAGAACNSVRAI